MPDSGFDAAFNVSRYVPQMMAAGFKFAGRYYSRNPRKNLSRPEADALAAAGIFCVTVFEANGDRITSFTREQGEDDAAVAVACAASCGQPARSGLYFAVDCDPSGQQIADRIVPYFLGVNSVIAGDYRIGAYGSGDVCATLRDHKLAELAWLGGALGWTGSMSFRAWNIAQGLPADRLGIGVKVDPDTGRGDYGQWMPAAIPTATPAERELRVTDPPMSGADVTEFIARINQWGVLPPLAATAIYDGDAEDAAIVFQQSNGLVYDGVIGPKTWTVLRRLTTYP